MTFAEYHATMTKKMPDAVLHPEMYSLCYELMKKTWDVAYGAADRIEALIAENKRLGQQCEGLMQAGMNNGQALIIAENKLAKAVEALEYYNVAGREGKEARATLAELKGASNG